MTLVLAEAVRNIRSAVGQINMKYSKEQSDAIMHVAGPMLVAAGPGSGKTTVITERIKYLIESAGINPADILVITFTKAAANEMEKRFKAMTGEGSYPVRFGTFHSIFFWIIKTAYNLDNSSVMTETEKRIMIERVISEIFSRQKSNAGDFDITRYSIYSSKDEVLSSIISQIGIVKADMIDVDNYYSSDMPENVFRQIYRAFEAKKKREGKIDFDDMQSMCYQLLMSREDILKQCNRLFKYIMVDEFQDSNKIQYEIFKLLAGNEKNVFVVGDDDQSVYGFRGARPEIMRQFERDFPNTRTVILGKNFRCDINITKASSAVIRENKKRFDKKLISCSAHEGTVSVILTSDEQEQYKLVLAGIDSHVKKGIPLEKQAVLYRTNMQPRRLALMLNRYGIPYVMNDIMTNIFDNYFVRGIIDYMRVASGDMSRATFLRIMNKPGRYLKREVLVKDPVDYDDIRYRLRYKDYAVERLDKLFADIKLLKKMKPYAAMNFIRKGVGFDDYIKWYCDEKKIDMSEAEDILEEFSQIISGMESYGELFEFMSEYDEILREANRKKNDRTGISLMTMHSAKGLEFDVVYIIDFIEGVMPYKKAKTLPELEEERRMVYVAMTRARNELYMYSPIRKGSKSCTISRFSKNLKKYICRA